MSVVCVCGLFSAGCEDFESRCASKNEVVTSGISDSNGPIDIAPVGSAWAMTLANGGFIVILDERPSDCDYEAWRDTPGETLGLWFCQRPTGGTYEVVYLDALPSPDDGPCPPDRLAGVMIQDEEGEDEAEGVTGNVSVVWNGARVGGTFDASMHNRFDDETGAVQGCFSAYVCE